MRHTVNVRPSFHYIGEGPKSGQRADSMQGYEVEFYRAGEFVEMRSYSFLLEDESTMLYRIKQWIKTGKLEQSKGCAVHTEGVFGCNACEVSR